MAVTSNLSGDLDINDELHEKDNPDQQQRESHEGAIVELDVKFVPLPEDDAVAWLSPKYYGTDFAKMDQTGERASEETRNEIKRPESSIKPFLHDDKQAPILADDTDIPFERETQVFAIHGMKMLYADIVQLSTNNKGMCMNSMLSAHHALRIVVEDSKNRREISVVSEQAKSALKSGGPITALLGKETRDKVEQVLKYAKLNQGLNSNLKLNTSREMNSNQSQQQFVNIGKVRGYVRRYDFQQPKVVPFASGFHYNQPFYGWPQRVEYANPPMFYSQQFGAQPPYKRAYNIPNQQWPQPRCRCENTETTATPVPAPKKE
ncbi:MAG: hypothetical protein EZS28_034837 [Streblomastix strix]|uniref:Uncharacterized protein n=1 Tax=Streblomastix strix TaxID=222440 RepID=A0A5J4UJ70_9EUKA|nr:MAG: hypothetical protein EZS28_034837 [Streblomastix strix]